MTLDDVLDLLKRECEKAGSAAAWAKAHMLSQAYVSDVQKRRRDPGGRLLDALGVEKVVSYRRIRR